MGATAATARTRVRLLITALATLSLIATQLVGFAVSPAEATFSQDSLDQWANGKPGTSGEEQWQNGNLNANNSQYGEGDSVAFRRVLTGLDAGAVYRVTINYDTINNSLVSYDYLTSYDFTEVEATPAADGPDDTLGFAADPRLASTPGFLAGAPAENPEMAVWGADLLAAGNYQYSSGTSAQPYPATGTTTTSVDVIFKTITSTVTLAWGGHIARQVDWDASTGYDTAPRNTGGSPYHMRNQGSVDIVAELAAGASAEDYAAGDVLDSKNAGNQDRSLKASAVLIPGLNLSKAVVDADPPFPTNDAGQIVVEPGDSFSYALTVSNDGEGGSLLEDVHVTDTVPAVFDVQSVTANPAEGTDCTASSGQDVDCTIDELASGASVVITVAVTVTVDAPDDCGLHTNDAWAVAGDLEVSDSVTVEVTNCTPDLDLVKRAFEGDDELLPDEDPPTTVALGADFSYVIEATNSTDATVDATGVVVTDLLPADISLQQDGEEPPEDIKPSWVLYEDDEGDFVEVADSGDDCATEDVDGRTLVTCDIGTLQPGEQAVITIPVTATDERCPELVNVAQMDASELPQVEGGEEDERVLIDSNTVTLQVDGCDTDVTFEKGAFQGEGEGETELVEDGDDNPPVLQLGDDFRYVLKATNDATTEDAIAYDVTITDTVPEPLEFDIEDVTATHLDGDDVSLGSVECELDAEDADDRTVICGPVDLDQGESLEVVIPVSIPTDAADICGDVTNAGGVSWFEDEEPGEDDEPFTDSDSVTITIDGCETDLDLDKIASPTSISVTNRLPVTYTVLGSNAAPATETATNVVIDDTIAAPWVIQDGSTPSFEVFEDYDPEDETQEPVANGDCDVTEGEDGDEVSCAIGDLEPGQTVVVTITVEFTGANVCTAWTNTAYLYADGLVDDAEEPQPDPLTATADVTTTNCPVFVPDPDISIVKTVDPTLVTIVEGDDGPFEVTYTYTVTNTGDVTLSALNLTDDVIGSLTGSLLTALGGTSLPVNATVSFDVDYELTAADIAEGSVTNVATVSGTGGGQTVSDNDDATVTIVEVAGEVLESSIALVKEAQVDEVNGVKSVVVESGGTADITYRYTITNTGDTTLTDLTLFDDVIGDLAENITVTHLAPGESTVVEVDYTTTTADLDEGEVINVAIVTGTDEQANVVSDQDDETVGLVEVLEIVEEIPRTGTSAILLGGLGLLLSALGLTALRLTPRRRELG